MGKMEDWVLLQQTDTLVKKAKELSSLCDIDVGLILFSPNGGLTEFASGESVEDLYLRYLTQPPETKGGRIENEQNIIQSLIHLQKERELMKKVTKIQETWEDAIETNRSHQAMKEKLSLYNPNLNDLKSVDDIYECEHFITAALRKIQEMKSKKLNDQRKTSTANSTLPECSSSANNNKKRNIIKDSNNIGAPGPRRNIIKDSNNIGAPGPSTSNAENPDV